MVETLSAQEKRVLELAVNGHTDKGIADALGISPTTVVTYWGRIRAKFGMQSRPELVAKFVLGLAQTKLDDLKASLRERAAHEAELAREVETLFAFIDFAPEAMLIVDADGIIQRGNLQAAELLECDQSEFPNLPVAKFIPSDIHEAHIGYRERYMKDPMRLAIGHDVGVNILTFKGNVVVGLVLLNVAKTPEGEFVVVMLRKF